MAGLAASGIAGAAEAGGKPAASLPTYCSLGMGGLGRSRLYSSSGNRRLDRALIAELRRIAGIIPSEPGFQFIDDWPPNAFATAETVIPGTRGTVILGLNMISEEVSSSEFGGVAVAGICAHECAHVFQFFSGYANRLAGYTARRMELHADYLAGYYMGRRAEFSVDRVEIFARSVFAKGDYAFNDPGHHGTPEERFAAMKGGYDTGLGGHSFGAAAERGAGFVERM